MSAPERIYLQPECCADPGTGRLWCEDDMSDPRECPASWTEYVRADIAEARGAAAMDNGIKAALMAVAMKRAEIVENGTPTAHGVAMIIDDVSAAIRALIPEAKP